MNTMTAQPFILSQLSSPSDRTIALRRPHPRPLVLVNNGLLRLQPRPRLRVLPAQLDLTHEEGRRQADPGRDAEEDPKLADPVRYRRPDGLPLGLPQRLDDHPVRRDRRPRPEARGHLPGHPGLRHPPGVPAHDALEDDLPDHHARPERDVPHERERRCPRRHVPRPHLRLHRDQQRLQVRRHPERRDHLEQHQPRPVAPRRQRHEQPERRRRQRHRPPHDLDVPPRPLDRDPDAHGARRQRQRRREQPHARLHRPRAEHRLEVQRQEEGHRGEPQPVAEVGRVTGDHRPVAEQRPRHQRVPRRAFDHREDAVADGAEDEEADDRRRAPGVPDPAELQPEEEHQRRAREGERAEPVDGRQPLDEGRPGRVDAQEEDEDHQRGARDREVDPEAPPPRHVLRQPAADERPDAAGEAPDGADDPKVRPALPRAEQVAHRDVDERHQPAAP
ncbi:hypothetical protein CTA1_3539 [Colletotrichum tanaceti]|uniref:Uncharacterized protein n=1 Tax=Colletotrichum tanaceti TaxID=1306861 RepID=A0A4U6XLQ6_9PEZI|nr:hypothetical protein CTA1_3539 [Colletotrichum tanaceti]